MARPHVCPVCQGRGTVPESFYLHSDVASSAFCRETCRTCQGFGMVWDYTDQTPGPGWGWAGPCIPQDINKTTTFPPNGTVINDDLGAKP